jgi:uncharacterized protein (TIGR02145 family)
MKENLKTTTYSNGTPIPNVTNAGAWSNLTTGAYAWYNNNSSWKDSYGALYNWYTTIDPNGLCPTGWHVPTLDEWTELTNYIGGTGSPYGQQLKSCRQVNSPLGGACETNDHPRFNFNEWHHGTDEYGFSGLPCGWRSPNGSIYAYIGEYGYWWASTEESSIGAWSYQLSYGAGFLIVQGGSKKYGLSVRCVKDN